MGLDRCIPQHAGHRQSPQLPQGVVAVARAVAPRNGAATACIQMGRRWSKATSINGAVTHGQPHKWAQHMGGPEGRCRQPTI